jgi:hypothetical protein
MIYTLKQTHFHCQTIPTMKSIKRQVTIGLICFISILLIGHEGYGQTAAEYLKSGIEKYDNQDYRGAILDYTMSIVIDP